MKHIDFTKVIQVVETADDVFSYMAFNTNWGEELECYACGTFNPEYQSYEVNLVDSVPVYKNGPVVGFCYDCLSKMWKTDERYSTAWGFPASFLANTELTLNSPSR